MPGMAHANEYARIDAWLGQYQRPLVVSHRRPDGDALGGLAAVGRALAQRGQAPVIALFDAYPPRYDLLANAVPWRLWSEPPEPGVAECDALVIVDTCSYQQLAPLAGYLKSPPPTLVIDHHATADRIGERESDLRVIDPNASAACVLIAEWLQQSAAPLDVATATALYVGVATDTGWFRYSNADARTLRVAADLLEAGVATDTVYRALHEQDPRQRFALSARLLETMQVRDDGRLVVLTLRRRDFADTGADRSMTDDLVNLPASLRGLELTVMFTEQEDGAIRVNFRSKGQVDVAALAGQFGGGGHARAAGARLMGDWDAGVQRVIAAAEAAL